MRGTITLAFDDGYENVFTHVLPLLQRFEIRAVFAIPVHTAALLERATSAPVPLERWKTACTENGHELAAHSVTHRSLTTLTDDELASELRQSRAATRATTFVYPGGAHDRRVASATRTVFAAARTVQRGFERIPPRDAGRLSTFVATAKNFSVWKWNLRALGAVLMNHWLIETYHDVEPDRSVRGARDTHTVPLHALEAHIRFLVQLPVRIATIRDIIHA